MPALVRAFAVLSDPAARRVVWWSILGALLGFLGLAALIWVVLFQTDLIPLAWLDTLVDVLGGLVVLVLAYLLFPAVVVGISSLLLDPVVEAVERRHYPTLPAPRSQGIVESAWLALRFFLVVAGLNLIALPLYLVPGLNLMVFYALNGYLLGREYFELVAIRRLGRRAVKVVRRIHALRLFSAGVIIAFLSTIPFVNLIVPVVATAFMVHLFHGLPRSSRQYDRE